MFWPNGHQILPTLPGWKVSNDIQNVFSFYKSMHVISHSNFFFCFFTEHLFLQCSSFLISFFFFLLSTLLLLNSQTLPSLFFWGSRNFACLSFRSRSHYILFAAWATKLGEKRTPSADSLFCVSGPDEVIYDDVPRENSDSNTGLWSRPICHRAALNLSLSLLIDSILITPINHSSELGLVDGQAVNAMLNIRLF